MHHPEFERLCDLADVRKLYVGLGVSRKVRGFGTEMRRELAAITITGREAPAESASEPIHRSIDAAARRLLEVLK